MNCTVHVRRDGCEIWVGNQAIARVAGRRGAKPPDCRSRKSSSTIISSAAASAGGWRRTASSARSQIAQHVDGPVKVVWTREEDIQHDMYRPYWFDRLSAGLDEKGMPVAWTNRFAGSSVIARYFPPGFKDGLDPDSTEGAIDLAYALPNFHVEYRAGRAAGHSDGVLAQRRAFAQRLRDRKLHG